ncbi:MAG TPA: proteasome accessory factor PafA2 family protein, partial [Streptosporangiaceae bacterium]|nr:proteasome accessory factor PafA2 family protein [Streptosporangiaceae bacterium]
TEQVLRLAESPVEVPVDHHGYSRSVGAVRAQRAYLAAARRIRRRPEDDIILDAWQAALDSHQDSRASTLIATAAQIETAVDLPPQTTRARLRGLFIKTAKDHRRDFTLDWVHLKLNDAAIRTVRCLDPLDASLEPAERLITSISGSPA